MMPSGFDSWLILPEPNQSARPGTVLVMTSGEAVTLGSIFGEDRSPFQMDLFFFRWYDATNAEGDPVTVKLYYRYPACQHVFQKEREVARGLAHPGVVRTIGEGSFEGCPFLVYEHLAGGTLRYWLLKQGSLPGSGVLSVARQIAEVLDFMHARGILHSDVQPGNVWLDPDPEGRAALAEFGVTKAEYEVADLELPLAEGGYAYAAPEQLFNCQATGLGADIYNFGIMLYELIAGAAAWSSLRDLSRLKEDGPDIRNCRKEVSERLALQLARTLRLDPEARPATAGAALEGVEEEIAALRPAPTANQAGPRSWRNFLLGRSQGC